MWRRFFSRCSATVFYFRPLSYARRPIERTAKDRSAPGIDASFIRGDRFVRRSHCLPRQHHTKLRNDPPSISHSASSATKITIQWHLFNESAVHNRRLNINKGAPKQRSTAFDTHLGPWRGVRSCEDLAVARKIVIGQ